MASSAVLTTLWSESRTPGGKDYTLILLHDSSDDSACVAVIWGAVLGTRQAVVHSFDGLASAATWASRQVGNKTKRGYKQTQTPLAYTLKDEEAASFYSQWRGGVRWDVMDAVQMVKENGEELDVNSLQGKELQNALQEYEDLMPTEWRLVLERG